MSANSSSIFASDVYQRIKARVIAHEYTPGKRLYIDPIAREFGVSAMPVRQAMNRLADESLIIKAPGKGFITMPLSPQHVVGQYALTRMHLVNAVEKLAALPSHTLIEYEPIAADLKRLSRRLEANADALARCTASIFAHIVQLSEDRTVIDAIGAANDHLYFVRTLEVQWLSDTQSELIRLCELLLAAECDELGTAIHRYHERRLAIISKLLTFVRS